MFKKIYDGDFTFYGFGRCNSLCEVKVYHSLPTGLFIFIVTESKRNEGTSVTNMAEGIATLLTKKYNVPVNKFIWIEHYDYRDSSELADIHQSDETFDGCVFEYENRIEEYRHPIWRRIEKTDVEKLIGEKLP